MVMLNITNRYETESVNVEEKKNGFTNFNHKIHKSLVHDAEQIDILFIAIRVHVTFVVINLSNVVSVCSNAKQKVSDFVSFVGNFVECVLRKIV